MEVGGQSRRTKSGLDPQVDDIVYAEATDFKFILGSRKAEKMELVLPGTLIPGMKGRTVCDFWRWAYSDIQSNRNRGIFAEFIVGEVLGVVDKPRVEWDATDHRYMGFKIEVKSAADWQSWHQEKASAIKFGIGKAVVWNPATGKYEGEATRCADLYVFCHYPVCDKAKANVLDIPAWDFYVVSTATLNQAFGEAKSLSLATVRRIGLRCKFDGLKAAVDEAFHVGSTEPQPKARL